MRRLIARAAEAYRRARGRARRRRSPWNLLLAPLAFLGWLGAWYAIFRLTWAFHEMIYPDHRLQDFWREGTRFSSFVLSFVMVFAPMPGAIAFGFALANCVAWLIPPARRVFDQEAIGYPGTGFAKSTTALLKVAAWTLLPGLGVALFSALMLRSLQ